MVIVPLPSWLPELVTVSVARPVLRVPPTTAAGILMLIVAVRLGPLLGSETFTANAPIAPPATGTLLAFVTAWLALDVAVTWYVPLSAGERELDVAGTEYVTVTLLALARFVLTSVTGRHCP